MHIGCLYMVLSLYCVMHMTSSHTILCYRRVIQHMNNCLIGISQYYAQICCNTALMQCCCHGIMLLLREYMDVIQYYFEKRGRFFVKQGKTVTLC